MWVGVGRAMADSSDFGLLWVQSSPKWKNPSLGRRWTAVKKFGAANFILDGEIGNHTNTQTITNISTYMLYVLHCFTIPNYWKSEGTNNLMSLLTQKLEGTGPLHSPWRDEDKGGWSGLSPQMPQIAPKHKCSSPQQHRYITSKQQWTKYLIIPKKNETLKSRAQYCSLSF